MIKKRNLIVVFILSLFVCNGFAQSIYTLKNQKIEISIDSKGNMTTLKNLQTGFNYASGKPLWRLYFDRKNEKDIQVLAADNQPSISQEGNQILLTYNDLRTRKESLMFKLSLKIVLEENMVRFSSEIANNELHTIIRELQYPLVANCQLPPDHQLLTTQMGGRLYPDPKKKILSIPFSYRGPDQYYRQMSMNYPANFNGFVASNCFAFTGKYQGLYFGSHDTTFQITWHGLRMYPDQDNEFEELEAGLYKYPNCLSGKTWTCNANVIVPYSGTWHQTSKIYRNWANTWWNHQDEPQWIKEMNGFQRIIMRHQYGETFFQYEDLANSVKKAGERGGIKVVLPFAWWNSGMDNGNPDYSTDPEQGGDKGWMKAIADYKNGGGKVILYYNGKLIDTDSEYYKIGDGKELCLKSNTGTETYESFIFSGHGTYTGYFNYRTFVIADTRNPKWRNELIKMCDQALKFGANSILYDQLGYGEKRGNNWDLSKEFPIQNLRNVAGKADVLKMVHEYSDKKDEEFAIGTEGISDITAQHVDYVHSVINCETRNFFIDWFRYTFPEIILTDRSIDGDEPNIEWLVNQNILLGLRNNLQTFRLRATIDETPVFQKYLLKANQLKEKYSSLLLLGTYRDTEGFSIDSNKIKARSFVNGNQMAIVMMTQQSSIREATTQISVPGYKFKESEGIGDARVLTGTNDKQTIILGKDGLMVLIYDRNN